MAVQLASSQFSPRTLHDWTGDRTQQVTIGLVLGTSVYCLMVLRETSVIDDDVQLVPHLSVLLAVILGILSLIAVVRYVDRLTTSLRIGSVARSITDQTVAVVHRQGERLLETSPGATPTMPAMADPDYLDHLPIDAVPVTTTEGGWVQQIDEDRLLSLVPDGSTVYLAVSVGSHVFPDAALVHVAPAVDDGVLDQLQAAIAVGSERTMQEDSGFGVVQLVDVALRAMSPGINDPNTANEMILNLGSVLLAAWSYPEQPMVRSDGRRSLIRRSMTHEELLESAIGPLRHHGAADPLIATTMVRMLLDLRSEVSRRELPGPIQPINDQIDHVHDAFLATEPPEVDRLGIGKLLMV